MFKKILKFNFILFISLFFFKSYSYTFNQNTQKFFIKNFETFSKSIIDNYNANTKNPLELILLDGSDSIYQDFFNQISTYSKKDYLVISYNNNITIGNKNNSSSCIILYEPNSNFLINYFKYTKLNFEQIFQYLSYHELAHCFYKHYLTTNNKKSFLSSKEEEFLADSFSLLLLKEKNLQDKVILANENLSPDDIHSNHEFLKKFQSFILEDKTQNEFQEKDILKLFEYTLNTVSNILQK